MSNFTKTTDHISFLGFQSTKYELENAGIICIEIRCDQTDLYQLNIQFVRTGITKKIADALKVTSTDKNINLLDLSKEKIAKILDTLISNTYNQQPLISEKLYEDIHQDLNLISTLSKRNEENNQKKLAMAQKTLTAMFSNHPQLNADVASVIGFFAHPSSAFSLTMVNKTTAKASRDAVEAFEAKAKIK